MSFNAKKFWLGLGALFLSVTMLVAGDIHPVAPAIIPLPRQMILGTGNFQITKDTKIYASVDALPTAGQLAGRLRKSTSYPFEIDTNVVDDQTITNGILLAIKPGDEDISDEGYQLAVGPHAVIIRASDQAGLFYGGQTLLQLLPPEVFSSSPVRGMDWQMPCVHIEDWPQFKWRGLMLDVSRHFYDKAEVERVLDLMALYKLNVFHWHLADSQGWRIEIKKYPKLTEVGSWRMHADLKSTTMTLGPNAHPAWTGISATKFGPDGRYGGFYTQNDIREVVAYASARHITIVPEIEMPGHSGAALAAYPQLGGLEASNNTDMPISAHNPIGYGIYNPANEQTFQFLDDVLSEVFALFPGQYIHIGGDEVKKDFWLGNPECRALMKREGLKTGDDLQSWFVSRIVKFANSNGKTVIGWTEILQGGLARNAAVMDWRGEASKAVAEGHDVVMAPNTFCFLNWYQSTNRAAEPRAQGGYTSAQKIYSWRLISPGLPAPLQSHVLGAEGVLWTEWIGSLPHVEYMIFPRLCALAEVVWSPGKTRNWDDFQSRLKVNEHRLDELKVNYYKNSLGPIAVAPPAKAK